VRIEDFVSRLDGVKQTGRGQWMARCPAHEDRSPSLSIGGGDDGRVLIKCFAGCLVDEIAGAVGLTVSDLFPERPADSPPFVRGRQFPAGDVLEALANEVMVVWVISRDMELGITPSIDEFDRLTVANKRIQSALELIRGKR
jgi:hypothetical protein